MNLRLLLEPTRDFPNVPVVERSETITHSMPDRPSWQDWLAENTARWLLYARQQTRSEADAEDVLQDALVKTWKTCAGEITPETSSLVYTNIRRCAIDRARSSLKREEREQRIAEEAPQTEDAWFEFGEDDKQFADSVQQALAKIPEIYREVVTRKIWGEQTFAQIAESLGVPQNTVASRYRYGLDHLRKLIESRNELVA